MEDWIFNVAKEYGPFMALVVYILWDSRQRELRYINIVDKLADSFNEIKKDVESIKNKLWG